MSFLALQLDLVNVITSIFFSSIPDEFAQFIDGIKIHGGGDTPEDVFGGLKVATQNLSWTVDPRTKARITNILVNT